MAEYNSTKELFTDVCDSLREKLGITGEIEHSEIAEKIDSIKTVPNVKFMRAAARYNKPISEIMIEMQDYISNNSSDLYDFSYFYNEGNNLLDITNIVFNLNNIKIYSMNRMFYNCSNLTSLDFSSLDTSNVFDMSYAFGQCSNLLSLNMTNFNTSNACTMSNMFYNCTKLQNLDVSNFDTSNVFDMSSMFSNCAFSTLDVSNFDTRNVTTMSFMFNWCYNLTSLNLSSFYTGKLTNMRSMFSNCTKLQNLDISNFDTSKVTDMSSAFYKCSKLSSLDVSNFDTTNVTDMSSMFSNCTGFMSFDVSNFDTTNVTNMSSMFAYCRSLTSLKIGGMLTSNTAISTISLFDKYTNQNIMLDFDGHSFSSKEGEVILNLTTIWQNTNTTKFEAFANSLGQNTSGYTRTIKIYTNLYNALAAEQKALVTDKGYTLSYGTS